MNKKSLSKLKKKAWKVFSKYYRTKHSYNGMCVCYTCGKVMPIKEAQCGHLLDGRNNSILFNEEAIRIQCAGCNMFKAGNKEVFIPKFIDEQGREKFDELKRLKNKSVKYSITDLEEMIKEWEKCPLKS